RNFIKKSTLAAAGTVGFLSLEWPNASAQDVKRKIPTKPTPGSKTVYHIPLDFLGLTEIPAIPFVIDGIPTTLTLLNARSYEALQAKNGLNNIFTINGQTATGFSFMYGRSGPSGIAAQDNANLLQLFTTSDLFTILNDIKNLLEEADRTTIVLSDDPITALSL